MLKYKVENLDDIEEQFKGMYKLQSDGSYMLQVDGVEDVSGLKNKNAELLAKIQKNKDELEQMQKQREEESRKAAEQNGEFEKLYRELQEKVRTAEEETARERQARIERERSEFAGSLASELSGKLGSAQTALMKKEVEAFVKYSDDGPYFEIGGFKVDSEAIKAKMQSDYPFLCAGTGATGGQAPGSNGKAVGGENPWKKETFNLTKQAEIQKNDPQKAEQLKSAANG